MVLVPSLKPPPKHIKKKLGNFFVYQQLQASHHTSFRMGASVACIAQHKDIPRHGIKNKLQGSTGVSTADDSSVGRLTFLEQQAFGTASQMNGISKTLKKQKKELWKLLRKKLLENGSWHTFLVKKKTSSPLPVLHQGLAHFLCDVASHCSIRHEARIALLQESQGFLRGNELLGLKNHCFL